MKKDSKLVDFFLVCFLTGFIFTSETNAADGPVLQVYQTKIELGTIVFGTHFVPVFDFIFIFKINTI